MKICNHRVHGLTMFLVLLMAGTAMAWGPKFEGRGDCLGKGVRENCILNTLSEDMKIEAETLMNEHMKERFVLRQDLEARRAELAGLMVDPVANQETIQDNLKKTAEIRSQLDQNRVAFQTEVFKMTGKSCVMDGCGCGQGPRYGRGDFRDKGQGRKMAKAERGGSPQFER
ncbi:MAG: periplasmic heavy metal sensor [Deltaproteobacteria bacterium]|nr:periplasmic heavy metal sensor [Deltaproteobacteria bacterium]